MDRGMQERKLTKESGFTLVEIAIVLVIVGLLLGGVLKGQELINNAKTKNVINQSDGVKTAFYAFQDRFGALPGDYKKARTNIAALQPDGVTATTNGDGNGKIDDNATPEFEYAGAWQHLSLAGLINGDYTTIAAGITYAEAGVRWTGCVTGVCPQNAFGSGLLLATGTLGATVASNELTTGGGIPVSIVSAVDVKVDDGNPIKGSFRLGDDFAVGANGCVVTATDTSYNGAGEAADCGGVFIKL